MLRAEDGAEGWSDALLGQQKSSATAFFTGIAADPVIVDNIVYVAGSANVLAAYQLNSGKRIWEQPISSTQTPWVAGDYLYVLSSDSVLMAIHRFDGRVKWTQALQRFEDEEKKKKRLTWSGPVLAGGRLLVSGAHGEMLEVDPKTGAISARQSIPEGIHAAPVVAGGKLFFVTDKAKLVELF